jgi:LruC domain-containing protein
MKQIKLNNQTTGKLISVPKPGEPPYAIIVPIDFNYPEEKYSITKVYPLFKNWAQNRAIDTDWYMTPITNYTYPNKFAQAAE